MKSLRLLGLLLVLLLLAAAPASAFVVNTPSDGFIGLTPPPGVTPANGVTSGLCTDAGGGALPLDALCWHAGAVLHSSETYALFWDSARSYPSSSKFLLSQLLGAVAADSGTLNNPFATTSQYADGVGRAQYSSAFRGAFSDLSTGYGGCPGVSSCVTDSQVRAEVQNMINANALPHNADQIFTLFTPPGVRVCSDGAGALCSITDFCSYHGTFRASDGAQIVYAVQPWTAATACSDFITYFPAGTDPGLQLASPLVSALLGALVDPHLDGWYGTSGAEIGDGTACPYVPSSAVPNDDVSIGGGVYPLDAAFSNAGVRVNDFNSPPCTHGVVLRAQFVPPSPVKPGDIVFFDGSGSQATLVGDHYAWDFGDGSAGIAGGAPNAQSVSHSYSTPGNYTVSLTITDEGGHTDTVKEPLVVLGTPPPGASPGPAGTVPAGGTGSGTGTGTLGATNLKLLLTRSSLRTLLRSGLVLRLTADRRLDAFIDLLVSPTTARRAHIHLVRGGKFGLLGAGTIVRIPAGNSRFRVRLSRTVIKRLARLRHLNLTVRVTAIGAGGAKAVVDAAARF